MTEFQISNGILDREAASLAREIFDDIMNDAAEDETADDKRDDLMERAHETADGHEWVIYTYKAIKLCAECNTTAGEEFLEDTGGIEKGETFESIATKIAYGELRHRIELEIETLIDQWEPEECESEAG